MTRKIFEVIAEPSVERYTLTIKNMKVDKMVQCEQCKQETDPGAHYQFYYGNTTGSHSSTSSVGNIKTTTTTTYYDIAGNKSVFLCHKCLLKNIAKQNFISSAACGVIALILYSFFIFLGTPIDTNGDSLLCLGQLGVIGAIVLSFYCLFFLWKAVRHYLLFSKNDLDAINQTLFTDWKQTIQVSEYTNAGDELAINLYKQALKDDGYEIFFTRERYSTLRLGKS